MSQNSKKRKMTGRQIAAILGIVLLVAMYVLTLIFSFMKSPLGDVLFKASLACTIIVPVLLYAFLLVAKNRRPAKSAIIDSILFDVGKVLLDTPWVDYLREQNSPEEVITFFKEEMLPSQTWRDMDLNIRPFDEVVQEFCDMKPEYEKEIRHFMYSFGEFVRPYPYMEAWLSDLRYKGYRLYILSNWGEVSWNQLKEQGYMDFVEDMDGSIWSFREHIIKPDRRMFELAAERFHLDPARTVFIDDSEKNVVAAQECGYNAILFKDLGSCVKELEALGVK